MLIGGRPAMGKTMFLLHLIVPLIQAGKHVLLHNLDHSVQQLFSRVLAVRFGVELARFRLGHVPARMLDTMRAEVDTWLGTLWLSNASTLESLAQQVRTLHATQPLDLLCQDYLQLLPVQPQLVSRHQEMALISRTLKQLSIELSVPVVATSQLTRLLEMRSSDKRPQLSDLRESGALEQDATQVLMLYRPEYYGFETDDEGNSCRGQLEVILAKNGNGPCDSVKLHTRDGLAVITHWP